MKMHPRTASTSRHHDLKPRSTGSRTLHAETTHPLQVDGERREVVPHQRHKAVQQRPLQHHEDRGVVVNGRNELALEQLVACQSVCARQTTHESGAQPTALTVPINWHWRDGVGLCHNSDSRHLRERHAP